MHDETTNSGQGTPDAVRGLLAVRAWAAAATRGDADPAYTPAQVAAHVVRLVDSALPCADDPGERALAEAYFAAHREPRPTDVWRAAGEAMYDFLGRQWDRDLGIFVWGWTLALAVREADPGAAEAMRLVVRDVACCQDGCAEAVARALAAAGFGFARGAPALSVHERAALEKAIPALRLAIADESGTADALARLLARSSPPVGAPTPEPVRG